MRGLHEKAHIALREFKEGRTSRLTGYGTLTDAIETGSPEPAEEDELAKLGGKTRLVSAKENSKSPSPQIANRSPNSMNPIVPLPLATSGMNDVHPTVVAYLQTFAPTSLNASRPLVQNTNGIYGQQPAIGGYGPHDKPALSLSGSFDHVNGSSSAMYDPHFRHGHSLSMDSNLSPSSDTDTRVDLMAGGASSSRLLPTGSVITHQQPQQPQQNQLFPQYFSVFDYAAASGDMSYNSVGMQGNVHNGPAQGYDHEMGGVYSHHDGQYQGNMGFNNLNGDRQRSSLSPEMTMQNNWNDLVAQWTG